MWKQDIIQLERKHWFFEQKYVKVQCESTHQFEGIGFDSISQSDARAREKADEIVQKK